MKHIAIIIIAGGLSFSAATLAQEAARIDPQALSALDTQPPAPKFFTKSIRFEKSREYLTKGAFLTKSVVVKINYSDGTSEEQPYAEVPLLFRVGAAELLDATSRANVRTVSEKIRAILAAHPEARFRVEGHASAEGDGAKNERLSKDRAAAILAALDRVPGILPDNLSADGRGSKDAQASATAPESERQLDRKVLVVRER